VIAKLRKMRTIDDDEDDSGPTAASAGRPAWMKGLKSHAEDWLAALPKTLTLSLPGQTSLARFFAREASVGAYLLQRIRRDLSELTEACEGAIKQTNEIRVLLSDLSKSL
jgi:dynein heavy chain 1